MGRKKSWFGKLSEESETAVCYTFAIGQCHGTDPNHVRSLVGPPREIDVAESRPATEGSIFEGPAMIWRSLAVVLLLAGTPGVRPSGAADDDPVWGSRGRKYAVIVGVEQYDNLTFRTSPVEYPRIALVMRDQSL